MRPLASRGIPGILLLVVVALGGVASAQLAPGVRTVDRTRALFPQTEHWFDLVRTARFDVVSGGRLRPDFSSLTHERVRHADGAGHHIVPTFSRSWRGPFRVESGEDPGIWIEVTPVGANDTTARIEDGLVVYPGAYVDTDILYKSTPTHVDEYRVLTSRDAPSRWVYRLRRGPGIARIRQAGAAIEAVDSHGVPWMRANAPFAVDARGVRVDGTVRVIGSRLIVSIDLSSLEPPILVDPDWRSTGDMAYGRFYNGANLLPDGRVLATGGCTASVCSGDLTLPACRSVVTAAEALDLGTRTWSRLGDASVGRYFHVAESLVDGSILTAGGCTDPACAIPTATAEIFDASASAFRTLPPLPEALAGSLSVRLTSGRVLVAGGCTSAACSARAHVFDPATETFGEIAPMRRARGRATASLLPDGRVLVVGGCTTILCAGVLADAEIFDTATGVWSEVEPMGVPRAGHFAVTLVDGRVLVGGGCAEQSCLAVHATAAIFDPGSLRWSGAAPMARPRFGALAARLIDGTVMVSQGCAGGTDCDLTNELYDPSAASFSMIEPALTVRAFHQLVVHPAANLVVAIGGCQPRTCSWWNETYDMSGLVPLPDAGPVDAGWSDAGPFDAGPFDGGLDAGRRDTGADAGATPPREAGCGCRAGARHEGAASVLALVVLGLAVTCRRRG